MSILSRIRAPFLDEAARTLNPWSWEVFASLAAGIVTFEMCMLFAAILP